MTARVGNPRPERLRISALSSALVGPFDLVAGRGECIAITGTSGSGKSLFLRLIADLDPGTGEVFLEGTPRRHIPAPAWRRQVVYCPAESGWWDERVAHHFPSAALGFVRAQAERLALDPTLLDGPVLRLSSGERQRLALIRALALDPLVLLLDEPTGALDADSTALVEAELQVRLQAGTLILMVTHSEAQAQRMAGRHLRVAQRRLVTP